MQKIKSNRNQINIQVKKSKVILTVKDDDLNSLKRSAKNFYGNARKRYPEMQSTHPENSSVYQWNSHSKTTPRKEIEHNQYVKY